jgi:hypothetical protein
MKNTILFFAIFYSLTPTNAWAISKCSARFSNDYLDYNGITMATFFKMAASELNYNNSPEERKKKFLADCDLIQKTTDAMKQKYGGTVCELQMGENSVHVDLDKATAIAESKLKELKASYKTSTFPSRGSGPKLSAKAIGKRLGESIVNGLFK